MTNLPLWISTDQAERLKSQLEGKGFVNVAMENYDGELVIRVFTGTDDGPEHKVRVSNAMGLDRVVERFEKWRKERRG